MGLGFIDTTTGIMAAMMFLSAPFLINGALMMWSRALGEFGAVVIIAYHPMVAPVLIYDRFNNYGLKFSAPVAAAMILISVMIFLGVPWWNRR